MDVLVIDDHPMIHQVIKSIVRAAFHGAHLHDATNLESALALARGIGKLDLALLEVGLPGCTGVEALIRFRGEQPVVPVVVISANDEVWRISAALAAGACGYIPKTTAQDVMIGALRLVVRGGIYVPLEALGAHPPGSALLTARQVDVLKLMARGCSNREIAEVLHLAENTVKQHVHAVFLALGASSRTQALAEAIRRGINLH